MQYPLPRRAARGLVGLLLGLLCACAGLPTPEPAPSSTQVTVTRADDGLRLDYRLERSQTRFRFNPEEHLSAAAAIEVSTPGLALTEGAIVGPAPFDAFTLLVRPDARRVDATYPVLARVGQSGLLLYTPVLAGDAQAGGTRFDFAPVVGATRLPASAGEGFVFVGPSAYAAELGALTLVTPPDVPPPLRAVAATRAEALLEFYARRLGRPALRLPLLVVDYDPRREAAGFVGDVTPNGVVLLQLSAALDGQPGGSTPFLSRFLAHEFFHLWNAPTYRDLEGVNGQWLREGSAEYAGWLAAEALWPEGQSLEERITSVLSPCMVTLGEDALAALDGQRAQTTRYSCGAIAQWLADVAMRRSGRGDLLDAWARLLAQPGGYDVHSFESAIHRAHGYAGPLDLMLRGEGSDRWPRIFGMLRIMGVHVDEVSPGVGELRAAALHTVLREACTGGTAGFETTGLAEPPVAVILRTEPMGDDPVRAECGGLAGDPQLFAVNGRDARGDWAPILRDVTAACEARGEIALTLRRGTADSTVRVRCTRPALAPRTEYRVRGALPPGA